MEREKLTVTIKNDLFQKIDSIIDGKKIRNRSHATEFLIEAGLGINKISTAVILAGGEGTRLRPFTYEIAKALLPIKGKPMAQYIIELLKKHGVTDIYLSVGYKGEQIEEYFGNGSKFGLNIKYIYEKTPLGTAGPLRMLKSKLNDSFFLVWADCISKIDFTDFAYFHKNHDGLATIALTTVDDPSRFGVASMKGSNITGFIEKPKREDATSNLINSGIAILEPEVIGKYIPKRGKAMVEKDLYPRLSREGKLFGYPFSGQWFDTGTHEAYEKAIKEWEV